jgi:hypothetical protein
MGNLTDSDILAVLSKISLPAQKREKLAEALTEYIKGQVNGELDRIRSEKPGLQEPSTTIESPREQAATSLPPARRKKEQN